MEFSEGLEKIDFAAFSESGVECVDLPSSVRSIGVKAFANCEQLRSVRLNEGLETLGEIGGYATSKYRGNVFECSALESIVIPSTLEVLEDYTFYSCRKLTSVTFAEGSRLREIGNHCFAESGLKAFEAPPSLRKICSGAFYCCRNLQRVVLNEGLKALGIDSTEHNYDIGAF